MHFDLASFHTVWLMTRYDQYDPENSGRVDMHDLHLHFRAITDMPEEVSAFLWGLRSIARDCLPAVTLHSPPTPFCSFLPCSAPLGSNCCVFSQTSTWAVTAISLEASL